MSEQVDRDALAEVLAAVIPHANWCDYDEKTAEGCQPGFGCNVHAERARIAEVVLASDFLAQRDRRVAAEALREAADHAKRWDGSSATPVKPYDHGVRVGMRLVESALRERADRIEAGHE